MDVLVVDDEPISRRMVEHALREDGYRVRIAHDGREALEMLIRNPIQLVVSDWRMPHMDGIALCRAVRAAELPRYTYFIMLTSRDRPIDSISGFAAGIDDYIAKPFNPSELLMRVNVGRRIVQLENRLVAAQAAIQAATAAAAHADSSAASPSTVPAV